MESMTPLISIILLVILISGLFIAYLETRRVRPKTGKSAALKKEEIVTGYEEEIETLLREYADDNGRCLQEKTKVLHRINSELSTNIFFDKEEVRSVIAALARQGLKS